MFRPDGWVKGGGYQDVVNGAYLDNEYTDLYEAGADAMLDALKKQSSTLIIPSERAVKIKVSELPAGASFGMVIHGKGLLVFIPDEVSQPDNGDTKESPCVRLHDKSA